MFANKNNNLQYQHLSLVTSKQKLLEASGKLAEKRKKEVHVEGGSAGCVNNKIKRILNSVDWLQVNHFVDGLV